MALLDRFRSFPANRHPDPEIRLAHVGTLPLEEREQLAWIAREDESARVRRAAVGKLLDPAALAAIARDDADAGVRAQAASMLRDIALEAFEDAGEAESLAAVEALSDPKILVHLARTATRESVARQALARVTDVHGLGSIARHAVLEPVRHAAFGALNDPTEIIAVAMNSEFKDTAVAAVERLTTRPELEQVAARSSNKSAVKRARGLLRELDERSAQEDAVAAPPEPNPSHQVVAERMHLVNGLARLAAAEGLAATEAGLREAEARWVSLAAIGPAPEPDLSAQFSAVAETVRSRLADARALAAERERVAAETARRRDEQEAAERADVLAAEEDRTRKLAERRRARLGELAAEAEAAAADEDLRAGKRRLTLVQREWRDMTAESSADSELVARYEAADARLSARETEAKEADGRGRRDALKRVQHLLGRVEPMTTQNDLSVKAAERALRDVRSTLGSMPPLPSRQDFDEVAHRLKAAQAALTPKLQELRALEDWQRWANVGIQEALCEKMEALKSSEDADEIMRRVRELQQQWRQAADVPRTQGEALWRRFKAAHDEVWGRCETHFAAQAQERSENLAKKTTLCERAAALVESTNWIQTADEIKRLQAEWKTIGPVSRGQEKAVWDRFRAACDRFFTRRHEDLARRKATWAENLAKKDALCVKAEALAESTEWNVATAEIKRLQAEWKTIGPIKKSRSEAIWQRFRGACDRLFARYAQRHEIAKGERAAAREALCAAFEALAGPARVADGSVAEAGPTGEPPLSEEPPSELPNHVRALRSRWQQEIGLRGVEPDRAAALDQRFAAAQHAVLARWPRAFAGTDLDPEANRVRMEALVTGVENLASSIAGPAHAPGGDENLSPTLRLASMLKEALAANTIGGRIDEDSRWRAAQEEVRQAQASWSRIGLVAEPARRALLERFQRACRRITERPAGADRTGDSGRGNRPAESGRPSGPGRSNESVRARGAGP